jgi:hypothetical protein
LVTRLCDRISAVNDAMHEEHYPEWLLPCLHCVTQRLSRARVLRNVLRDSNRREDVELDGGTDR